jgi:D-alanine transaminase
MSRIAYVNGRYLAHAEAGVHIEDRGYQFADGVYEVVAIHRGRFFDEEPHLDRLKRSLDALSIAPPMSRAALKHVLREVARRNGIRDGILYLQISRGVAKRDHAFPKNVAPSLVVTAKRTKPTPRKLVEEGIAVITIPDIRWKRCDIKSISLLPNILGKQQAKDAGAFEAWMLDEQGMVTEGTSTNAWIVNRQGAIVTRPAEEAILNGVTRLAVKRLAAAEGIAIEERPFSLAEAREAKEAFLTSTTSLVLPVVRIDSQPVADGKPGKLSLKLRALCEEAMAR